MRLENKIAIVTGAASGFGAGIARRFAAEDARVVVNDLNEAGAAAMASEINASGGRAAACAGDVSRDADVARVVRFAIDASLDHLRPWMPWAAKRCVP